MCEGVCARAATEVARNLLFEPSYKGGSDRAFGRFNRSGSLSEQEEIPLTSRVKV